MNGDNHHGWTKALFRPNSLHPDISRLCPDPFQMACRVHLKCVSSDQFWWDFASLLTCDFICGDADCCQTGKKSSEERTPAALCCLQWDFKMFSELTGTGKLTVSKLCHAICTLCYKAEYVVLQFGCGCMCIHTTLLENMVAHENSLLTSLNDSFDGCRDSAQHYNRACESSQIQAIRQVSNKPSLTQV